MDAGFQQGNPKTVPGAVWLRIYDLPLEYRKPQTLFNIASGAGVPLKIDPRILSLEIGLYARVLIEVDVSKPLPGKILVIKEGGDFFVNVDFEKLPFFASAAITLGILSDGCRKSPGNWRKE